MEKDDEFLIRYKEILNEQIRINGLVNKAEKSIERLKAKYEKASDDEKIKIENKMKEIEQTCEKLHNLALNNNKKVKALKKDYPAKKKDKKKK